MSRYLYLTASKLDGMSMPLSKRVEIIKSETGANSAELARIAEVTPTTVMYWEDGSTLTIKPKYAKRIASKYGYSEIWLITGEGPRRKGVAEPNARYSSMTLQGYDEGDELDHNRYAMVRVVDTQLSAGNGLINEPEYETRPLPFLRTTLAESNVDEENAVIVRIIGNSMEPVMASGDTVGVDTGVTIIHDGNPYAIRDIDTVRVKLLYRLPGGGLRIRSFNQAEYPDEILSAQEAEERIDVIGEVFWSSRMWR